MAITRAVLDVDSGERLGARSAGASARANRTKRRLT